MVYESAKAYHEAGLSLVNIYAIEDGACSCGNPECAMPGKHPQNVGWQKFMGMSNQFELIENYHLYNMHCTGFGFLLDDHHLVVDVDPKNGGMESFEKLSELVPELKECAVTVKTGGGGFHLYYNKPSDFAVRGMHPKYPGIDFKHRGGFVVAAGSLHASGNHYELELDYDGTLSNFDDAPNDLLLIIDKKVNSSEYDESFNGDLVELLNHVHCYEDYWDWLDVGMALHDDNVNNFAIWDKWSQQSSKYEPDVTATKWKSFGDSERKITMGTLIHKAIENGYKLPARGGCEVIIPDDHEPEDELNTDHIDILAPHGLVGDIVEHINSNAYRQRPAVAVLSALWSIGCVMGKMYIAPNGVRPNLIALNIAASGTGKGVPLAMAREVVYCCGLGNALHGEIGSSQDMIKNLVNHQTALYVYDEVHSMFKAASDSSSPAYLKTINDTLMKQYTDNKLVLRGLDESTHTSAIEKRIAKIEKKCADTESSKEFIFKTQIELEERKLSYPRDGVPNPFMSFYGSSTPVNLDSLVRPETIASGLIGRAIIVKEYDNYPAPVSYGLGSVKPDTDLPESIKERVRNIYHYGRAQDRTITWREDYGLEYWGEPTVIGVSEEAEALSSKIHARLDAEGMKSTLTVQPLYIRAFELVVKIAMILAAERRRIEVDDLLYAYALVKSDIKIKLSLLQVADGDAKGSSAEDRELALLTKLHEMCNSKAGCNYGQLKDRLKRKYSMTDVDAAIEKLVTSGHLSANEYVGGNNRKTIKYKSEKELTF